MQAGLLMARVLNSTLLAASIAMCTTGAIAQDGDASAFFTASLGYSAERGALADAGLTARGLFSGLLDLSLRGAWEEDGRELSAVARSADGVPIPGLNRDARLRFALSHRLTDWDDADFASQRTTFSAGLEAAAGAHGALWADYFIYEDVIEDVVPTTSSLIAAEAGTRRAYGVALGWQNDTTDHPFAPRDGHRLEAELRFAGLGGDAQWAAFGFNGAYYMPVGDAARLRLGGIAGIAQGQDGDSLRITERAFLSADLPRGFAPRGIGPRDLTTDTALGGERYAAISLDFARPLGEIGNTALQGHLFTEAGSVWSLENTALTPAGTVDDSFSLRSSVGVALSTQTEIGVFEVYLAHPVQQESYDVTQTFGLSLSLDF